MKNKETDKPYKKITKIKNNIKKTLQREHRKVNTTLQETSIQNKSRKYTNQIYMETNPRDMKIT